MLPWLETERASSSPAQRVPAPAFPFGADRRYFAVNPGIFFLQHATALLLPFGSNIMCQGRGPLKSLLEDRAVQVGSYFPLVGMELEKLTTKSSSFFFFHCSWVPSRPPKVTNWSKTALESAINAATPQYPQHFKSYHANLRQDAHRQDYHARGRI